MLGAGPAPASAPDLGQALAFRDLEPVRAWLDEVGAESPPVEVWRARIAIARIEDADAVAGLLDRARALHPDDAGLLLQQAALARDELDPDRGRFERMREARAIGRLFDHALELAPEHPEVLAAAVEYHREVPKIAGGREERIPELMQRLENVAPARAAYVGFRTASSDGRRDAARNLIDKAVELDPLNRPAWRVEQAASLADAGQSGDAIATLEALVTQHPQFGLAWFELGRQIARSSQPPARGIEALERYLLVRTWPGDPPTAAALAHLATLKARAGDAEGARRALEQARILDPGLVSEGGPDL